MRPEPPVLHGIWKLFEPLLRYTPEEEVSMKIELDAIVTDRDGMSYTLTLFEERGFQRAGGRLGDCDLQMTSTKPPPAMGTRFKVEITSEDHREGPREIERPTA